MTSQSSREGTLLPLGSPHFSLKEQHHMTLEISPSHNVARVKIHLPHDDMLGDGLELLHSYFQPEDRNIVRRIR